MYNNKIINDVKICFVFQNMKIINSSRSTLTPSMVFEKRELLVMQREVGSASCITSSDITDVDEQIISSRCTSVTLPDRISVK